MGFLVDHRPNDGQWSRASSLPLNHSLRLGRPCFHFCSLPSSTASLTSSPGAPCQSRCSTMSKVAWASLCFSAQVPNPHWSLGLLAAHLELTSETWNGTVNCSHQASSRRSVEESVPGQTTPVWVLLPYRTSTRSS